MFIILGVADNPSMVKKLRDTAYLVANSKESKLDTKFSDKGFIPYSFEVDKFWHENGVDYTYLCFHLNYIIISSFQIII